MRRAPILVTGSHRSGTGWVSDILAATPSPRVGTIWEPFNLRARRGVRQAPFRYWFTYVTDLNASEFRSPLQRMLAWRYSMLAEAPTVRSPKDLARMFRDAWVTASNRRAGAVPISKDPIAVFSAEWMSDTFGMDTIVLIRHPAAFCYSIVKQGWWHPFDHFTAQPAMMRDLFAARAEEIERFAHTPQPLLDQAVLLWVLIHEHIARMRVLRPEWRFVRLEDLSREPVEGFRGLYGWLDLAWDAEVERAVIRSSGEGNPAVTDRASSRLRDSKASISVWKDRLTAEEQESIRERTDPVWREFYGDEDW
jgi:Sulfotransferase family